MFQSFLEWIKGSNKAKGLIVSILATLLAPVALIPMVKWGVLPADDPTTVVNETMVAFTDMLTKFVGAILGLGIAFLGGQGLADGLSGGATSNFAKANGTTTPAKKKG